MFSKRSQTIFKKIYDSPTVIWIEREKERGKKVADLRTLWQIPMANWWWNWKQNIIFLDLLNSNLVWKKKKENIRLNVIGWFLINIQIQRPSHGHSGHFSDGNMLADGKAVFNALK